MLFVSGAVDCENSLTSDNSIIYCNFDVSSGRNENVNSRSKLDHPESFTCSHVVIHFKIADNSSRNEPRDLTYEYLKLPVFNADMIVRSFLSDALSWKATR